MPRASSSSRAAASASAASPVTVIKAFSFESSRSISRSDCATSSHEDTLRARSAAARP